MTRWARGCPSTQKKPHQSTPWSVMVQGLKHKKVARGVGHNPKKQNETRSWENGQEPLQRSLKPVKNKKVLPEFRKNEIESTGLAAELETITPVELKEKHQDKTTSRKCKKSHKEKKKSKKTPSAPETGLSKQLKQLKESIPELSVLEGMEIEKKIDREQKREKRRLKRIDERQSSKVCFNCRQEGHDMTRCPKMKKDRDQGTGLCFKCGSTEHTVHQCRVKIPPGEYPFAKCFICNEMGHLSKQCPDNPRGLYPKGGCCCLCESVEHYKKDCPELQKQQGINDIKLVTMTSGNTSIDDEISLHEERAPRPVKKKPKIVKF